MPVFLSDLLDITPASRNSWQTVDLSGSLSAAASGVMILCYYPYDTGGGLVKNCGFRCNGSTDPYFRLAENSQSMVFIGVDADKKIQLYAGGAVKAEGVQFYLVGYFEAGEAVFFTNSVTKSVTADGSYHDVTCSEAASAAEGAFFTVDGGYAYDSINVRPKTATDDFYGPLYSVTGAITKLDGSKKCEAKRSTTDATLRMTGYLLDGKATLAVDGTVKDVATGAYTDVDLTAEKGADSVAAIFAVFDSVGFLNYGIRRDGNTQDFCEDVTQMAYYVVKMSDPGDVVELFREDSDIHIYLMGFLDLPDTVIDEPIITVTSEIVASEPEIDCSVSLLADLLLVPIIPDPITIATWIDHDSPQDVSVSLLADLDIDNLGSIELPPLEVSGSATQEFNFSHLRLPGFTVQGSGLVGVVGRSEGVITLPSLEVEGHIYIFTASGEIRIPTLKVEGSSLVNVLGTGSIRVPLPFGSIASLGHVDPAVIGDVTFSSLSVRGFAFMTMPHEIYKAIVMNAFNYAVTEYYNYQFNSFAKFNETVVAAGPSGVYTLDDDRDDGNLIYAEFRTGLSDFRKQFYKYIREAWLNLKTDGQLEIVVQVGEDIIWNHDLEIFKKVLHEVRGKVARGLKDRYFAFGIRNVNGSDFTVDNIRIKVEIVRGRQR